MVKRNYGDMKGATKALQQTQWEVTKPFNSMLLLNYRVAVLWLLGLLV